MEAGLKFEKENHDGIEGILVLLGEMASDTPAMTLMQKGMESGENPEQTRCGDWLRIPINQSL